MRDSRRRTGHRSSAIFVAAAIGLVCTAFAQAGAPPDRESAAGSPTARERDPREIFARANRFYEAGEYEKAAGEYESLAVAGYRSAPLYYNLGNAYFKLDRKGLAILYYEKALELSPRDQDVRSNLDYARSLVEDRIEPAPGAWLVKRWNAFVDRFTAAELGLAASAFWWILCAILIVFVYAPAARGVILRVAAVVLALLLVAGGGALSRTSIGGNRWAVVLAREATVRYGPSARDVAAFVLHEGAVVKVENRRGSWLQISLPDGKAGWLKATDLGLV